MFKWSWIYENSAVRKKKLAVVSAYTGVFIGGNVLENFRGKCPDTQNCTILKTYLFSSKRHFQIGIVPVSNKSILCEFKKELI